MRLHLKAVLAITGLLVATTLALCLGSAHFMRRALRQEVDRRGEELVRHLAHAAEYAVFVGDRQGLQEIIGQNREQTDLLSMRFVDARGRTLASWSARGSRGAGAPPEPPPDLRDFCAPVTLGAGGGSPARAAGGEGARTPRSADAGARMGRVCAGMSYSRAEEMAAWTNRAMAGIALPVAAIGVLATLALARRAARPLGELARGLEGVAEGRPVGEVSARGRDELAHLGKAFNRMLRDMRTYREEVERAHTSMDTMVRKRTHELEQANRELVAASRTKSEFLANVSHELRTPLNAILGFLGLVIDGQCKDAAEAKDLLRDAQQGARHLLSIINSILDLAKIETGKMSVQLEEVIVAQVVEEVRSLMRAQADLKGIDLVFEPPGAEVPAVLSDPGKLKQVLVNLVGNAIKFTEEGRVGVRAEVCEEKGHVRFEVHDTGVGVPPEKQHLLFEKFQQIDGSTTRRHGGSGLGLAICRALVEMMGGKIWLQSEGEGKGTTVAFTVPIYRGPGQLVAAEASGDYSAAEVRRGDPDRAERPAPLPERGGPVAMVVEDDPACRLVLREILALSGCRVIEAVSADEAMLRARQARPRLITVDLGLPADTGAALVDGCDLMRALLRDPDTRGAHLMLISGQDPRVIRQRLERENLPAGLPVLAKPIDAREMLAWAESHLQGDGPGPAEARDPGRPDGGRMG